MRQRGILERIWVFVQRSERAIIRLLILTSVILVLGQFALAGDPVEFYLALSEEVEAPALDFESTVTPTSSVPSDSQADWELTLQASPAAAVLVVENGRIIADLSAGVVRVGVEPGTIYLDGRGVSQPVSIQVQIANKNMKSSEPQLKQITVNGNVYKLQVAP